MKAMVLAAGLGTRLGELTRDIPKCLIEVGGKPMLELVIERLRAAGVRDIVVNLHHLADRIESFLKARNNFGLHIELSKEPELLGTGGGLQKVEPFFSDVDNFYLYNADIYCDLDLKALMQYHVKENALASLVTMDRPDKSYLLFDSSDELVGWEGASVKVVRPLSGEEPVRQAFCGIQVLSKRVFNYMIGRAPPFSTIEIFCDAAQAGESIKSYPIQNILWSDMGTPESLAELRRHVNAKLNPFFRAGAK